MPILMARTRTMPVHCVQRHSSADGAVEVYQSKVSASPTTFGDARVDDGVLRSGETPSREMKVGDGTPAVLAVEAWHDVCSGRWRATGRPVYMILEPYGAKPDEGFCAYSGVSKQNAKDAGGWSSCGVTDPETVCTARRRRRY